MAILNRHMVEDPRYFHSKFGLDFYEPDDDCEGVDYSFALGFLVYSSQCKHAERSLESNLSEFVKELKALSGEVRTP